MIIPIANSQKDDIPVIVLIGFVLTITLQSSLPLPLEMPQSIPYSDNGFIQQAQAQQRQQLPIDNPPTISKNISSQNKPENIMEASGHFANNQIKDGVVTWIQGGYWNLRIIDGLNNTSNNNTQTDNNGDNNNNKNDANFLANFTMIRPDGSLSHNHLINNFSSNNVILSDNDIVVTGMADIHSNNGLEYKQVPLIVHLMGKKVLGLTIDVGKTKGHFASPNEMFGTLISGVGINGSNPAKTTITNSYDPTLNESSTKASVTMTHH
jgi:hypothetical protein